MNFQFVLDLMALLVLPAGVLLLLGILLIRWRRNAKDPRIEAILQALQPLALKAIFAGESLALQALQTVDTKLTGADKKLIADSTYALLPTAITVLGVTVNPKSLIDYATWSQFVDRVFMETDAFVHANEEFLKKQVEALVGGENGPPVMGFGGVTGNEP